MAIDVQRLSFSYDDAIILRDISFRVSEGRFTVVLGKNGSGKSTLLKLLAGLLPCPTGHVQVLGRELNSLPITEKARIIGYLPQFHTPAFAFTVEEVVLTGRASFVFSVPGRNDREKTEEAMEKVGLSRMRRRPYTELSGGERQLVMIARVLAQEPRIILLDEPLSHLDLSNQARFLALVRRLVASGLTVLAVLHDPNTAFISGDNFILLKEGAIMNIGSDKHPWDAEILREVYGTAIETVPFRDRALVTPL